MASDFCSVFGCGELLIPPPIPPVELLPRADCWEILKNCSVLSSLNGTWSTYSEPCLPAKVSTAIVTPPELTTASISITKELVTTAVRRSVLTTKKLATTVVHKYPQKVTKVFTESTTTRLLVNATVTPHSLSNGAFPDWLIGVIVVAAIFLVVLMIVIVVCIIKSKKKGERCLFSTREVFLSCIQFLSEKSPERRADYVLSDYNRVNYLHNKMERGQKYKQKKKSRPNGTDESAGINMENGHLTISPISALHENNLGSTPKPDYDDLSKCYTRQTNDFESSCSFFSDLNSSRRSSEDRGSRIYTPTIIDGEPEFEMPSSAKKEFKFLASREERKSITSFSSKRGSNKESPYAVSDVLPNVPDDVSDDYPPPAPHVMYANHQFEKLQGFQNQSFVDDEQHRNKPLPPNPFPDLRSHTSLYAASLFENAGEGGLYKKKKKPIPKKRKHKKREEC